MRAPLLGQAAAFAALVALSSCVPGSHLCPGSLDCARAGRHFCRHGGSRCGPCLRPLVENSHGRCVISRRRPPHLRKGKTNSYPELDEEIDFLSAVISEQRTESHLPAPPSQEVLNPKAKQLSDLSHDLRGPSTEQPGSHSVAAATPAPPLNATHATNATPTLLRDPVILSFPSNDHVFLIMSSVFIVAGSLALLLAGACWVRFQKGLHLTQKVGSPAHRLIRAQAFDNVPGDKKLAHSAQMYHYQHQKQQMLSLEKNREEPKVPDSGASTDEENEDGDFTVYECPGLAPTGEMEVKNPLFDDSPLYLQRFH